MARTWGLSNTACRRIAANIAAAFRGVEQCRQCAAAPHCRGACAGSVACRNRSAKPRLHCGRPNQGTSVCGRSSAAIGRILRPTAGRWQPWKPCAPSWRRRSAATRTGARCGRRREPTGAAEPGDANSGAHRRCRPRCTGPGSCWAGPSGRCRHAGACRRRRRGALTRAARARTPTSRRPESHAAPGAASASVERRRAARSGEPRAGSRRPSANADPQPCRRPSPRWPRSTSTRGGRRLVHRPRAALPAPQAEGSAGSDAVGADGRVRRRRGASATRQRTPARTMAPGRGK